MIDPARHVLFITGEYPPLTGGVGAYTEQLANALVDLGWQASVLTTVKLNGLTDNDRVTVYPLIARWNWRTGSRVIRLANQIGASWLHVQYQTAAFAMNASINFAAGQWRRSGHKVAWTYHDLLVPYLFPKAGQRLRTAVTRRPATQADLTIVTNEGDRRQLAAIAKRLVRIPIGSNIPVTELTVTERRCLRSSLGYTDADFLLAYFGFLNRSKGGKTLIRTLHEIRKQTPNAKLLMIGERVGASDATNFAYLQEVEALVTELDLQSVVQWTGRLDDEEVSRALQAIDVLFIPYEDGASLRRGTLMAGLAHGCAIVTTHPQSPTPELTDGKDLLYVPPSDPQTAASAILHIAADPLLALELHRGAELCSRQFTWQEIALRHVSLYESVA